MYQKRSYNNVLHFRQQYWAFFFKLFEKKLEETVLSEGGVRLAVILVWVSICVVKAVGLQPLGC